MEKQIIIVKPKSLSPKDKEKLTKAGNIVIEHENSENVIFKKNSEVFEIVYTNCYKCGERIYLTTERLSALKFSKSSFFCSHGHSQAYK
jgi:hypothetical protein